MGKKLPQKISEINLTLEQFVPLLANQTKSQTSPVGELNRALCKTHWTYFAFVLCRRFMCSMITNCI